MLSALSDLEESGATATDPGLEGIVPPNFDEDEDLDLALTLAAKQAEEAATVPPPPPTTAPPPSPSLLPNVSDDDVAKAAHALIGIMPGPSQIDPRGSASRGRSTTKTGKPGRSASHVQGSRSRSKNRARLESEPGKPRQSRLDDKYYKEYAVNFKRLEMAKVSKEEQGRLETGLVDMDIIKMQRRKLAEIAAKKGVNIAPRPIAPRKSDPGN